MVTLDFGASWAKKPCSDIWRQSSIAAIVEVENAQEGGLGVQEVVGVRAYRTGESAILHTGLDASVTTG